jgi:hypothetical protein
MSTQWLWNPFFSQVLPPSRRHDGLTAWWLNTVPANASRILHGRHVFKLSLCFLIEHHSMKAYWGSGGGIAPRILWRRHLMEVSAQLHAPAALPPGKRAPGTHLIGGWVGPRAVLDAVVKRKIPSPHRESNTRTQIVQPVAQRYTDWAITALGDMYSGGIKMNKEYWS